MKEEFVKFVETLMQSNPELTNKLYTDDIKTYFEAIKYANGDEPKAEMTEAGLKILTFFQEDEKSTGKRSGFKSSDIASNIGIASRNVSGSIRKLVTDGYIEKVEGTKPIVYLLTNKGINYKIN